MTKKEINEIRAQYTLAKCGISKIVGCYVDGEKKKVTKIDSQFLTLSEEEQHKYFEILKKSLSGIQGKNLFDMEFSVEASEEQGAQTFLLNLRDSDLKDEHLLDEFYDRVIETYHYVGNYLIILIEQAYDVPAITTDDIEMEDASDEVYKYLLCSICPVKLSKAGLGYDEDKNAIRELDRNYLVDLPNHAFLFPAFTDRSEDRARTLFYTKDAKELPQDFIANVLDCYIPMPAKSQKTGFNELIEDTLGEECDYETVKNIHENLNEIMEEQKLKELGQPLVMDKHEMRNLFEKSGVKGEQLERFDDSFDKHFVKREFHQGKVEGSMLDDKVNGDADLDENMSGVEKESGEENAKSMDGATQAFVDPYSNRYEEGKIVVNNIVPQKKLELKTPDVVVKINSERTDLVDTRIIDGQQYLVIRVDEGLEVNGIPVTP